MEHKKLLDITDDEIGAIYDSGKANTISFIRSLVDKINEIDQVVKQQQLEIDRLKAIVAKDSHNSSKPPSTDGFRDTPKPKSQRKKGNKKVGGQQGHHGTTLKQTDTPDEVIFCKAHICAHCHNNLDNQELLGIEKRQVVDIEIKKKVTEYQRESKLCTCGTITKGEFPGHVTAPVQYGESVKAISNYLSTYQLVPYQRLKELLNDIFCLPISTGTLVSMNVGLGKTLKLWKDSIKEMLISQRVLHFDETGFRLFGERFWLHSVSTKALTYYQFHKKRGTVAMNDNGILTQFTGVAMHDFWKPYLKYSSVTHILCNAHLLRELIFLHEQHDQAWAKEMITLLLEIKEIRETEQNKRSSFSSDEVNDFTNRYDEILKTGFAANPETKPIAQPRKRGRPKKGKILNLLERFQNYQDSILAFMNDWDLPFDNNIALFSGIYNPQDFFKPTVQRIYQGFTA